MLANWRQSLSAELYGGLLILSAMAILGLGDNIFYYLEPHMGLGQFHALRSLICLILLVPFALITGARLLPDRWGPILMRTAFLSASMFLYFGSLPIMSVAEAAAGLFTAPIFVLLFTRLVYKERIGVRRILAVMVGTIGVLFVLRPDEVGFHILQLMPVAGGALYAMAAMTTRRYCADEPPLSLVAVFFFVIGLTGAFATTMLDMRPVSEALFEAAPFFFRGWMALDLVTSGWIIFQGSLTVVAIALLTRGYQVAETSYMAVFEYSLLIFAAAWTYIMFGQALAVTSIIGFVLIASAGVIVSRALPSNHQASSEQASNDQASA